MYKHETIALYEVGIKLFTCMELGMQALGVFNCVFGVHIDKCRENGGSCKISSI